MKFTITINQAGIVEFGLADKTDLTDWAILGILADLEAGKRSQKLGNKVWMNYKQIMAELPLSGIKDKGAISRRIARLEGLKLIETEQSEDKRLFAKTTRLFKKVNSFKVIEKKEEKVKGVDEYQQGVDEYQQGVDEYQQGVDEYQHSTVHNTSTQEQYTKTVLRKNIKKENYNWQNIETPEFINREIWEEWMTDRAKKRFSVSRSKLEDVINELTKVKAAGGDVTKAMLSGMDWQGFEAEWALNKQKNQLATVNSATGFSEKQNTRGSNHGTATQKWQEGRASVNDTVAGRKGSILHRHFKPAEAAINPTDGTAVHSVQPDVLEGVEYSIQRY